MFSETFFIYLVIGTMAVFSIALGGASLYQRLGERRKR